MVERVGDIDVACAVPCYAARTKKQQGCPGLVRADKAATSRERGEIVRFVSRLGGALDGSQRQHEYGPDRMEGVILHGLRASRYASHPAPRSGDWPHSVPTGMSRKACPR